MSSTTKVLDESASSIFSQVKQGKRRAVSPALSEVSISTDNTDRVLTLPGSFPSWTGKGKGRAVDQSPSSASTYASSETAATTFDMTSMQVGLAGDLLQSSEQLALVANAASPDKIDATADAHTPTNVDAATSIEDNTEEAAKLQELKETYEAMEATGWASYHVDAESGTDNSKYKQSMGEFIEKEPLLLYRDDEPANEKLQTLREFFAEESLLPPTDDGPSTKNSLRSPPKLKDIDIERARAWSKQYENDPSLRKDEISPRSKSGPAARARVISNPFRSNGATSKLTKGLGWRTILAKMSLTGLNGRKYDRTPEPDEMVHATPYWKQESSADLCKPTQNPRDPLYNPFQKLVEDVAKQDESLLQSAEPDSRKSSVVTGVPCRSVSRRNAVTDLRKPQSLTSVYSNSSSTSSSYASHASHAHGAHSTEHPPPGELEAEAGSLSPAELEENTGAISSALIKTLHKTVERQRSDLVRAEKVILELRMAMNRSHDVMMDTRKRQLRLLAEINTHVPRERGDGSTSHLRPNDYPTRSNNGASLGGVRGFFSTRLGSSRRFPPISLMPGPSTPNGPTGMHRKSRFVKVSRASTLPQANAPGLSDLERIQRLARKNCKILDDRLEDYYYSFQPDA